MNPSYLTFKNASWTPSPDASAKSCMNETFSDENASNFQNKQTAFS